MNFKRLAAALALLLAPAAFVRSQDPPSPVAPNALIEIRADQPARPISRLLNGACIEDVNHEIYGGLYSQMIYGESFQEPDALAGRLKGFQVLGGTWRVRGDELHFSGNHGDKIVSDLPKFATGEVTVEVFAPDRTLVNAGLIVHVDDAKTGADNFDGYEISLNAADQNILLGRHQHNYRELRKAPCEIPTGQWVPLTVKIHGSALEIFVNGKSVLQFDEGQAALKPGGVGLRVWQREARFRGLQVQTAGQTRKLAFEQVSNDSSRVSGMWRPVLTGDAKGTFTLDSHRPFIGGQSQGMAFVSGQGEVGVENQGLNRWGMHFVADRPYEGVLWAKADAATELFVALETRDGSRRLAERELTVDPGEWRRLTFDLTPNATASEGRFVVALREPGAVVLGHTFLQPGAWGRFQGLPVRRDVAQAMIDQGLRILRYGGSMVNHPEYRWKKMIGPRDRRPPHRNTWYPYSSNGWGIPDFMNFCEAAGFECVPAFCIDETVQDMTDFISYAKSPADSEWGKRRAADGHPAPHRLRYLQLGNEERVDERYFERFKPLAEAIWAQDPQVVIVVGDFLYSQPIRDSSNFSGNPSGITSLSAHRKILQLAKEHGREVWFDVHINTDGPRPDSTVAGTFSFIDALEKLADGAKFKVAVFELNSGNHRIRRALANALAIQAIERDGRIDVVCSANGLQPDGQNDNGWDQGLLFLNPSQVWLQPPGYVTKLFSRNDDPQLIPSRTNGAPDGFDVNVKLSGDRRVLILHAVNPTDQSVPAAIQLQGFTPRQDAARVRELSGPLTASNTAAQPDAVTPQSRSWRHDLKDGKATYSFPPRSITVIEWE